VERAGIGGITVEQLVVRTGIHRKTLKMILSEMFTERKALLSDKDETRVVAFSAYKDMQDRIIEETTAYHERFPLKEGLQREELRTILGRFIDAKLFFMAIKDLEKNGRLVIDREYVRIAGHRVDLKGEMEELREDIVRIYMEAGLTPPTTKEAMARFAARKSQAESVFGVMLKEGSLVKISEDLYFYGDVLQQLRKDYRNLLIKEGKATPANFRELTGLSRKFIIPLMEYFDMTKLTIRAGEHRILRDKTVNGE
jgi:selenocysteine-specific elongation factor